MLLEVAEELSPPPDCLALSGVFLSARLGTSVFDGLASIGIGLLLATVALLLVRECKSPELPEGIFTMGDDGSQQTRVIPAFHDDTYYEDPAFSPGGIQLAFTVDEQEGSEGTGDSVVGHGSGLTVNKFPRQYAGLGCFVDYDGYGEFECDIRDPSWDPTGSQVVYTINDQNGMIGLYILGPGPEALPQFLTQGSEAAWNSPGDATAAS